MQTETSIRTLRATKQSSVRRPEQRQSALERFLALPEGTACQLIAGKLVMSPAPIPLHQAVILELSIQMALFVKKEKAGRLFTSPIDVRLNERNIFQPDILFISKEKAALIGERMIEGPPDLVAEVLSPSSAYHDLRTKFRAYAQAGVQEYWIVDPERKSVEVFVNNSNKFQLRQEAEGEGAVQSVLLQGLSVDLADIFP
ncbi:Uma2 family endonuclease [Candidatus Electronema sp. PJ]|uniref:Uma2 family endonuclease n=1 Tax=Candidatus Electronema sp. PJ TaxID=3401572 RepID=UPI003AA80483